MLIFWAIILLGIAGMLGIMGTQQYRRNYRVAASFSLVTAVLLAAAVIWILVSFDL